ncbi:4Fe-4S binding protein [Candidatus Micrarchaeota archaeon]|jgi:pyruvate formate lyase activating enzyme|nr:4Fe-4S binding protein [Candidatus Micrarchaeota archaeon]
MVYINGIKCIKCGACVGVCPTQALTLTEKGIVFDKTKCINCGACIQICPANAISKE